PALLALLCAPAVTASSVNVAVLGINSQDNWNRDVQAKLMSTALFATVDVIDVTSTATIPSLATLQRYDAILVYTGMNTTSTAVADALGDRLADYIDAGGGVLDMAVTSDASSPLIGGRFRSGQYVLMAPGTTSGGVEHFMGAFVTASPILRGVA